MGSISDFELVLSSVAAELGQREVHLAALGTHIRRRLPDFSPADYGCATFTDLIGSCANLGELRFGVRSEDRWFVFAGPLQAGAAASVGERRIAESVWDACVDLDDTARAWLDFMDQRIETNPETVAREPERYVELPRFDRTRQIELLRGLCDASTSDQPALSAIITTWGASTSSQSELVSELQQLGLQQAWSSSLHRAVRTELEVWADEHGLPLDSLFHPPPAKQLHRGSRTPKPAIDRMDEPKLRAFLKAAIDEMTLAELGQWAVPARLLLKPPD